MNTLNYTILDIPFFNGTTQDAVSVISKKIQTKTPAYICAVNTHSVVTATENPLMKASLNESLLNTVDGVPIYWIAKLFGIKTVSHTTGFDLMIELLNYAEKESISVYFYGCDSYTLNLIEKRLKEDHPNIKLAGTESPGVINLPPTTDQTLIENLNSKKAQLVFVGLGCPKQEIWMRHHAKLTSSIFIGIGAAFDFYAGTKKRSPRWMTRAGLEWTYRLLSEPKRLFKRYLINNSKFIALTFTYLFSKKLVRTDESTKFN